MENKYITGYWIELLPNGVYRLCVNCSQKEIYYHAFNDNSFLIAGTEEEYENYDSSHVLEIEEFLPKIKGVYLRSDSKNKAQISFFWIPFKSSWIGKEKLVLQSKK